MAIKKLLQQGEETKKKKKIEVQEIHQDQINFKIDNVENLTLKNYLYLKIQFIRNLQEFTTTDEAKYVKSTDILEMLMQKEIDFLSQLLESQ